MENSMGIQWKIHGISMDNKNGKRKCFSGTPWVPMGGHGDPWAPMRNHGFPWVPMGSPWGPMGPVLWVQFFGPSGHTIDSFGNIPECTGAFGGVYFVFLHQEGYRKPPGKHFVIHGQIMETRSMENPWKIQCKNHGKNHGKLNGKSMENPWII